MGGSSMVKDKLIGEVKEVRGQGGRDPLPRFGNHQALCQGA